MAVNLPRVRNFYYCCLFNYIGDALRDALDVSSLTALCIDVYVESLFHRGDVQKGEVMETLVISVSNYAVHGSSLGWLR